MNADEIGTIAFKNQKPDIFNHDQKQWDTDQNLRAKFIPINGGKIEQNILYKFVVTKNDKVVIFQSTTTNPTHHNFGPAGAGCNVGDVVKSAGYCKVNDKGVLVFNLYSTHYPIYKMSEIVKNTAKAVVVQAFSDVKGFDAYLYDPDLPIKGSSHFLVGDFQIFGSMQERIFSLRYSSSRRP